MYFQYLINVSIVILKTFPENNLKLFYFMEPDMSIIRVSKNKKNPYFLMNNTGINDKNLSFKAKGLLAYLISKPDNWYINYRDLSSSSLNGIKSIRSAVRELISFGYITLAQFRQDDGKFAYCDYIVYEVPQFPILNKTKFPPHSPFRHAVKRHAHSNTPLNTNNNKILKLTTTTPSFNPISSTSAADVLLSSNKKTSTIKLLKELNIKNHKKLFDLFHLSDIFNYATWIRDKNFKMKNPTGYLITAIKEKWIDNIDLDSADTDLFLFYYRCKKCNKVFGYEEPIPDYKFCNKCGGIT